MKADYMPKGDTDKADLLIHVRNNLPGFFAALAVTAATPQVAAQFNDATVFDFVCREQQRLLAGSQQATAVKNRLRDGDPSNPNAPVSLAFMPAPPAIPSPVTPNVIGRFRAFVRWLKSQPGYTIAIGEALLIEGDEQAAPDLANMAPNLGTIRVTPAGVEIPWRGLSGADGIELEVDRGTGFAMLTIDTTPGYSDTHPYPAVPARWKYRGIFRQDDGRIGFWSPVQEVIVGA